MNQTTQVILASASPRRRELLAQLGVGFDVLPVDVDESHRAGESAEAFVQRLAMEKAQAGYQQKGTEKPVLGSDTIVVSGGQILGKPSSRENGLVMLANLSGQQHDVLTAVAMVDQDKSRCLLNRSKVFFRQLNDDEIQAYWDTGEPVDKAGGYAVQGLAAQFIKRLDGSYSGVMGLPLYETAELLNEFGVLTGIEKAQLQTGL